MPTIQRYLRGAAVLLAAATITVFGTNVPAHADAATSPQPSWHRVTLSELRATASKNAAAAAVTWVYVTNVHSGKVLAVSAGSDANGAPIIQWPRNAGAQEQAWTLAVDSAGYTVFRNAGTSTWKAIGISGSSTANGAKAIQWSYVSLLKDQEWIPGDYGDGTYDFENRNSLKCLAIPGASTSNGTQAIQWPCSGGTEQRWVLYLWS